MPNLKVEPFEYQESTNIDEHNQMVNKTNEIIDVINDLDLDNIPTRLDTDEANISKNTSDISQLKISDTEHTNQISVLDNTADTHAREITALKASDTQQNSKLTELATVTDALTKELPTEITLYRDGTGKIKAQVTKEDETTFGSNVLDMIIPYQYDIIPGSTNRSFKLDITMSNGDHVVTNDFLIPEGGGTDVTVTGVTLTKDSANSNKVKVSIKLSDGTPLESGYIDMVTAVSGTFANSKLTITVNGVSSVPIDIDTGKSYSAGDGIAISESNVISINQSTKEAIGDSFNSVALGSDGNSLEFTANDGQVNNIAIPSNVTIINNPTLTQLQNMQRGDILQINIFKVTNSDNILCQMSDVVATVGRSHSKRISLSAIGEIYSKYYTKPNDTLITNSPYSFSNALVNFDIYLYSFAESASNSFSVCISTSKIDNTEYPAPNVMYTYDGNDVGYKFAFTFDGAKIIKFS